MDIDSSIKVEISSAAELAFKKGEYKEAVELYDNLYMLSNQTNQYYLSRYGFCLRKLNRSYEFVELCDKLLENKRTLNQYILSIYCWSIYDVFIKSFIYKNEDKEQYIVFLNRAKYIVENSTQKAKNEESITPFVLTVKKVVKIYNSKPSKNYKEIIKWLLLLDPDLLSEDVYEFKDDMGKDRELASSLEFYYSNLAKCYEKTEQYFECISICSTAFTKITKFHHRNHLWLKARLYFCKCMVEEDINKAIENYKLVVNKEKFWFMFHKLASILYRNNRIDEALLYASKAICESKDYDKMINLFLDIAFLWQAKGLENNARVFFQASAYYRNLNGWQIPQELQYMIIEERIDYKTLPNIIELKSISKSYIESVEVKNLTYYGLVSKIFEHGCSGFIKQNDNKSSIYFNLKDVKEKKISVGDKVEYELVQDKDGRFRAINIKRKDNYG